MAVNNIQKDSKKALKDFLDRFVHDCSPLQIKLNNRGFCCTKTQFRGHKSHHSNNNRARQTKSSSLHCHEDCPARRAPRPTPEKVCRPPTSNFPPLQRQWLQARGGRSLCPPSPGRYCEQWPTLRRRRDGRLPFGRSLQLLSSSSLGCSSSNKGRCPPHHHSEVSEYCFLDRIRIRIIFRIRILTEYEYE